MKKKIILVGYFSETIELCEKAGYEIVGIIDNHPPKNKNYCFLGNDDYVLKNKDKFKNIPIVIVPDSPILRERLYTQYHNEGFKSESIISPKAIISRSAIIGEGSLIQDGCNISANVKIGKLVRINSMANIMHDSILSDFATIAPSSVVLGRCSIGRSAYIGANSTILPNLNIGNMAVVGAGSVVTKDVTDKNIVVGNPSKKLHT